MNSEPDSIQSYYTPNDLYNRIIDGLRKLGKDPSAVTLNDLQPVDEFHIRSDKATRKLIKLAQFTSDMHILDVGCGIGGSSRRLSHETGCRVTGVDLSEAYIDTAQRLTELLSMQERVRFEAASALDMPFQDGFFRRGMVTADEHECGGQTVVVHGGFPRDQARRPCCFL